MKSILHAFALALTLAASATTFAAASKSYQVTGKVLEVTDTAITVEKGKEKWVLMRDASTKVTGGEVKVGEKITASYTMAATDVEVKPAKEAAGDKKKK